MIAKKVYEALNFERGEKPYDSLQIGRVEERKYAGYNSFFKWLKSFGDKFAISEISDILENCYFNNGQYEGNNDKEKKIFLGQTYDELSSNRQDSKSLELYRNIVEYLAFETVFWTARIAEKTDPEYKDLEEKDQEEIEMEIDTILDEHYFYSNLVKYFIDKWPGDIQLGESIHFEREGDPIEKLKIGRYKDTFLEDALFRSMTDIHIMDLIYEEPNLMKEIGWVKNSNDWKNILFIDTDSYCKENNIDEDDLNRSFIIDKIIKSTKKSIRGGLDLKIGHLKDGSKIINYYDDIINGYMARKEWLK
jgi:hypothetical protein